MVVEILMKVSEEKDSRGSKHTEQHKGAIKEQTILKKELMREG